MDKRPMSENPAHDVWHAHRNLESGARFWRANAVLLLATLLIPGLTGCRALPEYRTSGYSVYDDERSPPNLDLASITAVPPKRSVYREIQRLESLRTEPGARLRVAFLLGEVARTDEAMTELNGLLFGDIDHGPTVESFARYLRAEAFARAGDQDRAADDRRIALAHAVDPALKQRLSSLVEAADASARSNAGIRNLSIRPRSAWSAKRPSAMDPMGRVYRATVHHSAILARDRSVQSATASIQAIQRNHQRKNGWSDIGYHYLIDAAGRVWEGREARWQGAHAGNPAKNRGNIGVCMLGNFIDGGQKPTRDQENALASVILWLQRRHGFDNSAIYTHNEFKVTECPGAHLRAVVHRLRGAASK